MSRLEQDTLIFDREPPVEEPEPEPEPIEEPEFPGDPGTAEDPEKHPVREDRAAGADIRPLVR